MIIHQLLCSPWLSPHFFQYDLLTYAGGVRRDDLQLQFSAQHSVAMLEQCWNNIGNIRNNVATMLWCCCALQIVAENRLVYQKQNFKERLMEVSEAIIEQRQNVRN